jgi:hypothetical protein
MPQRGVFAKTSSNRKAGTVEKYGGSRSDAKKFRE